MVKIMKGSKVLVVPGGAYRDVYASSGWVLAEAEAAPKPQKPEAKPPKKEPEQVPEEVEDDENVEYVDPEELLEKPLEELDYEELKILAEYLGIDTTGMRNSKSIRSAIKKANK